MTNIGSSENAAVSCKIEKIDCQAVKNYNSVDIAKFICAILVVMVHVAPFEVSNNSTLFSNINYILQNGVCRVAVPLFFVFSGYFLYRKTTPDSFSIVPTKKYLKRILEIYVIWSIIYCPLSFLGIIKHSEGMIYGTFDYLRDMFLVSSYNHLWYLPALIFAVGLTSLLYKKLSPRCIFSIAFVCYIIGLLGDGYKQVVEPLSGVPIIGTIILWYARIFTTTRNGLFFGFVFVAMGMLLANSQKRLSTDKSLIMFLLSMILMCLESIVIRHYFNLEEVDMLLFALPSALFGFLFVISIDLNDSAVYKTLRNLSSLIYYGHMWVNFVIANLLGVLRINFYETPIRFLIVLTITIVVAVAVIKLSNIKMFNWLKKIY